MNRIVRTLLPWRFWPSTLVLRWIERRSGGRVISGPFAGLRYVGSSVGSSYGPKLLGTYELELASAIRALIQSGFARVVDVGAAEGYYAVGLALEIPGVQVVAFEAKPEGQKLLRQMAHINNVQDRVVVHGLCEIPELRQWIDPAAKTLVIMDAEGAEKTLLDPVLVPALRTAHVLVEIHDHADADIGQVIRLRFGETHQIERFDVRPRHLADYPVTIAMPMKVALHGALVDAIDEHRDPSSYWFSMVPIGA